MCVCVCVCTHTYRFSPTLLEKSSPFSINIDFKIPHCAVYI